MEAAAELSFAGKASGKASDICQADLQSKLASNFANSICGSISRTSCIASEFRKRDRRTVNLPFGSKVARDGADAIFHPEGDSYQDYLNFAWGLA